jgi:tetratricopeptide (TPR) repeat protein
MHPAPAPNPIAQRLDKLTGLWNDFRALPKGRVCRWVIEPDERQMVEVFLEATYQAHHPVEDLLLPFYTPCTDPAAYSRQLVEELRKQVEADRPALAEAGIAVAWQPQPARSAHEGAGHLLRNLQSFAGEVPDTLLVAVLMPPETNEAFARWLREVLRTDIPARLRLLVLDPAATEPLAPVAAAFPGPLHSARPALDMPAAMQQLAAAGNPADPGVRFRQAFLALSQAASRPQWAEIQRLETLPLAIAREQGWMAMEVAVHCLVAAALIGLKRLPDALDRYERAFGLTSRAAGDQNAAALGVQCLSSKGSVYLGAGLYPEAAQTFERAGVAAKAAGDPYQLMEALRMQGYCLDKSGQGPRALAVQLAALVAARGVDAQVRRATLPYLGHSLLELAARYGKREDRPRIEQQMNALAGPGWQKK